jgi:hypothetical protein
MGFFKKLHNKVTAPDVNVEIKLGSYAVALGENLQGSLALSSKEDFDSTEIRCEVVCTEEAKILSYQYDAVIKRNVLKEVQESRVLFAAKPILNGATHVGNGENRNIPLNINIPAGGRPTYQGIDRRVTWTIKGVVAVDGRPDATSHAAEIQVVQPTAQQVFTGQTIVKEVVREVVKIPCRYCQTLFDQLEVTCPNCGAKRIA